MIRTFIVLLALTVSAHAQINNPGQVTKTAPALTLNDCVLGAGLNVIKTAPCSGVGAVTSVFTRTGAVVAAVNDYNFNQLAGALACSQHPALTGDITTPAGSCASTLATVNGNVGTFGNATTVPAVTVNAKGLITAVSGVAITFPVTTVFGRAGAVVATAGDYNATQVNYTSPGTGAVLQTVANRLGQELYTSDFGVICDGATNTRDAIQAALDAAGATGKKLNFSSGNTGTCRIGSAIAANGPFSHDIEGSGTGGATIEATFATGDIFTYNVTNGCVRNLQITSSVVRTSGANIKLVPNGACLENVVVDKYFTGVHNTGLVNNIKGSMIGRTGSTARSVGASRGIFNEGILGIVNTTIASGTQVNANMPAYGIQNWGEIDLANSYIFNFDRGIFTNPPAGKGGIMTMTNTWIDGGLEFGVLIDASNGSTEIGESLISNSWIACGFNASSCVAAVSLSGAAIRTVGINGNMLIGYSNGAGSGIFVGGTSGGYMIGNNFIGITNFGFAQGVFTGTGAIQINITGNLFVGNTTALLFSAGNDDVVVSSNNMSANTNKITGTGPSNYKAGLNTGVNIIAGGGACTVNGRDDEGRITVC